MSEAPLVRVRDDGVIEYRASALGGCDMALLAARLGYDAVPLKADSPMMKVFNRGERIEDEILDGQPYIRERQQEIWLDVTNKLKVIGHIDGYDSYDKCVVEVKSQSQDAWDAFEKDRWLSGLWPRYKWQVSSYMLAYDAPLKLIRVLVDKDGNRQAIDPSYVDEPFYSMAEIRSRILRVEAAAATGVLNAECSKMFPCPYFYLHDELDRELVDDETIDVLAREYAAAGAEEKAAGGKKRAARTALREAIDKDRYKTSSGVRVTFYTANNPPQLDKEMLELFLKKHDREVGEFMRTSQSERVKVTLPKEVDEPPSAE